MYFEAINHIRPRELSSRGNLLTKLKVEKEA